MTAQTKALLFGTAAAVAAKWWLKLPWPRVGIIGLAIAVAYLVVSDLPEK